MGAVVQPYLTKAAQSQIGFMDKRRRLQCVIAAFVVQVMRGELMKLVVDHRHEVLERLRVAAAPSIEELRDLAHSGCTLPGAASDLNDGRITPRWQRLKVPSEP